MPYIKKQHKDNLKNGFKAGTPGELNYLITLLLKEYIAVNELSYQTINDVVGALEGAKAEFQRRIVNPYEDAKIQENGDVYDRS